MSGIAVPFMLSCVAIPLFNYFLVSYFRKPIDEWNAFHKRNLLFTTSISIIMNIILGLAVNSESTTVPRILEFIGCIMPPFASGFAIVKVLYRSKFAKRDEFGVLDTNPYSWNGCLPEILALSISIIVYPILIIILEKRAQNKNFP